MGEAWFRDFAQIRFTTDVGLDLTRRQNVRFRGLTGSDSGSEIILDARHDAPVLRAAPPGGGTGTTIVVSGRDRVGDSGAGLSYRWVAEADETMEPDDVLVVQADGGNWHLIRDGTRLRSGAAGVKGDCKQITDGVRVAGQYTVGSPSGGFANARAGMRVLICEPSSPATGTVTINAASQTVTGTGTQFLTDIPRESWDPTKPKSAGVIFIGSTLFVIYQVTNDTSLIVKAAAAGTLSGATLYRNAHTEAVIQSVQSATQVTLDVAATVSMAGLRVDYGTNDDDAIDLFEQVCHDNRIAEAFFQEGVMGIYENHTFGADVSDPDWQTKRRRDRRYFGAGKDKTIFRRLRDMSWESPDLANMAGLMWVLPYNVEVSDMSMGDCLPILGVVHTAEDAVGNTSAGRCGFFMRHPWASGFRRMGADGYGSRDEYLLMDSSYESERCFITDCQWDMVNSNGVNPNSGSLRNFICTGNNVGGFFSAAQIAVGSGLVGNNIFRGQEAIPNEGAVLVLESAGKILCVNNVVEGVDYSSAYSTSPVQIFGSNSSAAQIVIVGMRIRDVRGTWHTAGGGAVLEIEDFDGSLSISDLMITDAAGTSTGSRFILIRDSSGRVHIGGAVCVDGTNMTIGLEVFSSAGDDVVSGEENLLFGVGVTTPVKATSLAKFLRYLGVAAGGTNAVQSYVDTVNVTYNGATTAQLRDPSTMPPGWTVAIGNDTTQLGTTSVTAAAGTIVGSASLAGAGAFGVYKNMGSYWLNVA
jgi:hypothetical protein